MCAIGASLWATLRTKHGQELKMLSPQRTSEKGNYQEVAGQPRRVVTTANTRKWICKHEEEKVNNKIIFSMRSKMFFQPIPLFGIVRFSVMWSVKLHVSMSRGYALGLLLSCVSSGVHLPRRRASKCNRRAAALSIEPSFGQYFYTKGITKFPALNNSLSKLQFSVALIIIYSIIFNYIHINHFHSSIVLVLVQVHFSHKLLSKKVTQKVTLLTD